MADIPKSHISAVIFDRDGVLNIDHGYVGQVERLEWMAGAKAAVRRFNEAGVKVLVATNQSGVARGYFDEAAVARVHAAMQADLASIGAHIDAFYVCPFHADATVPAYAHPDPAQVILVGDQESDMTAASRGGVTGVLFAGGNLEQCLVVLGVLK